MLKQSGWLGVKIWAPPPCRALSPKQISICRDVKCSFFSFIREIQSWRSSLAS